MLRRVDHKSTPTTTNIHHPLPRTQPQLPAKILKLTFLSSIYAILRCTKIGTRVEHSAIQEKLVEVVRAVIMVHRRLLVRLFCMQQSLYLCRARTISHSRRLWQTEQACAIAQQFHLTPTSVENIVSNFIHRLDIPLDIKIVINVCLTKCQLTQRQQHLA